MNTKRINEIKSNLDSIRLELLETLKEVNKEKSFREMGEILGTNHAHLNRILLGKQDVSLEKLVTYVDTLKNAKL